MSVDPSSAPYRDAFVRGANGLYYRIGGAGSGPGGIDEVHVGATAPTTPFDGQMWVDTTGAGSGVVDTVDEVYVGATPPPAPFDGQMWVDLTGQGAPSGAEGIDPDTKAYIDTHLLPDELLPGANITLDKATVPGSIIINGQSGGGGGASGPAPGLVYLDDMAGSNDDQRLDAAIAKVQTYTTVKPAIVFGSRRYDFSTANRPVFNGLKLIGLAGHGDQQRAANSMPNDIRFNGSGTWWVAPPGATYDVYMGGLSLQGNANAQFMSSNPGVLWTSVFENLGFNLWKHIFGNPSDPASTKFLNTAIQLLGFWNINNCYGTACTFGGSDSNFWVNGGQIDSPTTLAGGTRDTSQYHVVFDYQEKSHVGPIYMTTDKASGIKITGGSTTSGLVFTGMGRVEGRNTGAPCWGSNIRIEGGVVTFRDYWVAYGASNLNGTGHSGEGGVITQTGGEVLYDGVFYDRAAGVNESVPFIHVSGGTARVRNIRTGTKGGAWTGKPLVARTGTGEVDADNSVTVSGGAALTMDEVLPLAVGAPVPVGTPTGTLIVRYQ